MIALQGDETEVVLREVRHFAELALGNTVVEVVAVELVIKIFHAVDFVFAFLRGDEQANMIPFTSRLGGIQRLVSLWIGRGLVESIEPAATDFVGRLRVILELELGAGGPGSATILGDVIHDAAVAAFGDVVIELEFEPVVFIGGDDIASVVRIDAGDSAVLNLPTGADAFVFEIVPAFEVFTIEQKLPSGRLFLGGEGVGGGGLFFARGTGSQGQRQTGESD